MYVACVLALWLTDGVGLAFLHNGMGSVPYIPSGPGMALEAKGPREHAPSLGGGSQPTDMLVVTHVCTGPAALSSRVSQGLHTEYCLALYGHGTPSST
jgi:hypothetical protein